MSVSMVLPDQEAPGDLTDPVWPARSASDILQGFLEVAGLLWQSLYAFSIT